MSPPGAGRTTRRLVAAASLGAAAIAAAIAAACAPPRPAPRAPTAAEVAQAEWPRDLALAQVAATRLEFALADSVLRAFTARFPGTPQAAEASFWRALLRLDPAAAARDSLRDTSRDPLREAAAALDAYLAGGPVLPRHVEAAALRRLAAQLDSLRAVAGGVRGLPSPDALRDSLRLRDEEIARLRQALQETTAELERIRRRLAPRRP